MSGFIRRYPNFPGQEVLTQIEGSIIIDSTPSQGIQGVGIGCVAMVGEFADASYAVKVAANGDLSTKIVPVEVYSGQDFANKVGGFDNTLGEFGGDGGNGFVSLRNKRFPRLVCVPIDNVTPASGTNKGVRLWRDLPTNKSVTDATPITPVTAGVVAAGREFLSGSNRIRTARALIFGGDAAYASGVDGGTVLTATAVTQTFTAAGGNFVARGVATGHILVVGVIGAGTLVGTYRVVSVTDATNLVIERLDGVTFAIALETAMPWRLHVGRTADSAGVDSRAYALSSANGYSVLARPLDATITAATLCAPTVVPDAGTATSWDVLSGLKLKVSTTDLTYSATVHAPNLANNSALRTRYGTALDGLLSDASPSRDVNIVVCSRRDDTIRSLTRTHVKTASERGLTRRMIWSPPLDMLTLATAIGDTGNGVGTIRSDRQDYAWPGVQTFVPEAVGFTIPCADGTTTADGILDDTSDTWLASVEAGLAPERNPGQSAEPVPTILSGIVSFQRGAPTLSMAEYIAFRSAGICAPRFDRVTGVCFQSGVTTSLTSGEKNISRRRMADFIQDSISQRLNQLAKLPMSDAWKDAILAEIESFMSGLLSENNTAAQRIRGYSIDDRSGNTDELEAAGVWVVQGDTRLLATGDFIVYSSRIGENVVITQAT